MRLSTDLLGLYQLERTGIKWEDNFSFNSNHRGLSSTTRLVSRVSLSVYYYWGIYEKE